ncbi:MAG: alkaline phosphatase family protein [Planctomycetota bacterium]|nr:alkaline phosphatase family protein [Planctomycetota bacterium]
MTKKVLILALDSVNREALQPHLDAGRMPNLARLIARGASGILRSTLPAHTAPAWTTLATGKHPGVHGVLNFRRFDPRTQQARLNTTQDVPHKTVWQLLDEAGLQVGVVCQPQSYPVRELKHGFVVSGFETPSTDCDFTWPRALKDDVLKQVPEFRFRSERVRDWNAGKDWTRWDDFSAGMDSLCAENEHAHALSLYLATSRFWDVLFLYCQATDALFHKAWRWCDPETRAEDTARAARIDRFFARLDEMLGQFLALRQAQDAVVLVCSDHGHGPAQELVRVNGLLADLGFLQRGGVLTQARAAWKRVTGRRRAKGLGIAVDWARTRAYMPFEAIAGFLYLNRQGREPGGIVGETQAPALMHDLVETLARQTSPHSGRPLFDALTTPAEAYPQRGGFEFPDLFALPARGVNLVRKLSFGPSVEIPGEKQRGTHRPEGFFALSGAGVLTRPGAEASLADLAPTILAALGLPVPSDMTGRALSGCFSGGLEVRMGAPATVLAPGGAQVYSDAEKALVERRLADLGYVD